MNNLKILFAHDMRIIKNVTDNKYYSALETNEFWSRYLEFSNNIEVAVRVHEQKQIHINSYNKIGNESISFIDMPNLANYRTRHKNIRIAKKILTEKLKRIDVVIVRLPSEIGYLTYKLAKKLKIPVAVEMVGCPQDSYYFHGSLLGKLYSPYAKLIYKKALTQSTHTLYVTEKYLQEKYPSKGYSINASNVNLKLHQEEIIEKRLKRIKLEKEVYKIGTIGSLNVEYKGLNTAIEMLREIKLINPNLNLQLEVVGDGEKSKWEDYARKNGCFDFIVFKGRMSSHDVHSWLENIDIYIQPSKTEGLPRALIEAMSVGVPSIGSKVGGIPELLEESLLHSPGNYKELSEIINRLLTNEKEQLNQATINFKKSKEYSSEYLEKNRSEFYKIFIQSKSIK